MRKKSLQLLAKQEARRQELQAHYVTLRHYLQDKFDNEDWHGVQDAASDLRDIDAELKGLNLLK